MTNYYKNLVDLNELFDSDGSLVDTTQTTTLTKLYKDGKDLANTFVLYRNLGTNYNGTIGDNCNLFNNNSDIGPLFVKKGTISLKRTISTTVLKLSKITISGFGTVYVFTQNSGGTLGDGTMTFSGFPTDQTVDILCVGGGGRGGINAGGGGGGVHLVRGVAISNSTYSVTVGKGGFQSLANTIFNNGGDSKFGSLCLGYGGGSGSHSEPDRLGKSGGSGGGSNIGNFSSNPPNEIIQGGSGNTSNNNLANNLF